MFVCYCRLMDTHVLAFVTVSVFLGCPEVVLQKRDVLDMKNESTDLREENI